MIPYKLRTDAWWLADDLQLVWDDRKVRIGAFRKHSLKETLPDAFDWRYGARDTNE